MLTSLGLLYWGCSAVLMESKSRPCVASFLAQPPHSVEVLCVGSSHAYCAFMPCRLLEKTGVSAYVLGTSGQPLEATCRYIDMAFDRQSPKVVMVESVVMRDPNCWAADEVLFLHESLDALPFGRHWFGLLSDLDFRLSVEEFIAPIIRFHPRWKRLTSADFRRHAPDLARGARVPRHCKPQNFRFDESVARQAVSAETLVWVDRLRTHVASHGAELVVLSTPHVMDDWKQGEFLSFRDALAARGVKHIDLVTTFHDIGLDGETCFSDAWHLNVTGAERATDAIGAYLTRHFEKEGR